MRNRAASTYIVLRKEDKCTKCRACVEQCTYGVHSYNPAKNVIESKSWLCSNCLRCVEFCPTGALTITRNPNSYRMGHHWNHEAIMDVKRQAETGSALLEGMGCDGPNLTYWDRLLLNACQVTNPPIDPIREPIETRVILGRRPPRVELKPENRRLMLKNELAPYICAETPILLAAMSYGAVNLRVQEAMARAAIECGTYFNCGEGGLHPELRRYGSHIIVQVASGRFGVDIEYLNSGVAVEIKIGQGAKPGIGGHLPGEKVTEDIAMVRMIPKGTDALSPAPHHDVYSIEDLRQLIYALKEATEYKKPVAVKIAAVHNAAAIASGIARAGADIIVLDGVRGSTGAAPKAIRDNMGIPIELALAAVDRRLREEGIRSEVSIIASGGIRSGADVVKAIALGADAVYIGTAALIALGCTLCKMCYTGRCAWGIATTDAELSKRLNLEEGCRRVANLIKAWTMEIKEMMGAMGIDTIEALRGNRELLRGVGLTEGELRVLGIKVAGE
ncbi:MAG: glutamate synthase-related protein [Candidatus Nezhaarchaeota archaeon]|nr:glutamate synthase-related protein [Candidatus Nezhaarchaeota archaeon]